MATDGTTKPGLTLPTSSQGRKNVPLVTGVLDYFPAALAEVAKLSKFGNDKHNPGEPLHWARGKSMDHADCIGRHLTDRGIIDPETGLSHTVEVAWRALALLQEEMEANGAPLARGAWVDEPKPTSESAREAKAGAAPEPGAVTRRESVVQRRRRVARERGYYNRTVCGEEPCQSCEDLDT